MESQPVGSIGELLASRQPGALEFHYDFHKVLGRHWVIEIEAIVKPHANGVTLAPTDIRFAAVPKATTFEIDDDNITSFDRDVR